MQKNQDPTHAFSDLLRGEEGLLQDKHKKQ